jgi:hypothetical protein
MAHHMGMGAEALSLAKKLKTKLHIDILKVYVSVYPSYLSFNSVKQRLGEPMNKKAIRRITRLLARKGLCQYGNALFNEDGEVCGSGYCATSLGKIVLGIVCDGDFHGD